MTSCPTSEKLQRFLDQALGVAECREIEAHVEQCQQCRECLERLTSYSPQFAALLPPGRTPLSEMDTPHENPSSTPLALPQVAGYEILEELGRGGMGVVYKARQCSLNRTVALKLIKSELLDGLDEKKRAEVLDRFHREGRAAAQLQHNHIVPVHEVGQIDGCPFYSMRYVPGSTLARLLQDGPMDGRQAARYLEPIGRAVHYAHTRDQAILHRDLKPANILVDCDGQPWVVDFGLAKVFGDERDMTRSGELLGTPSYMSPEQARDPKSVTAASDVYSLGATLYDLLTGRPPFRTASVFETLRQVQDEEPVSPRSLNRAINRDLETICLKCLQKEPHRRYATAADLADDLQRYLNGRPINARRLGMLGRGWRWCRRNPTTAGLLAGIAILLFMIISATLIGIQRERRAERERAQMELKLEREKLDLAQKGERDLKWQADLGRLEKERTEPTPGWRERATKRADGMASVQRDDRLRDEAVAALAGLDAQVVQSQKLHVHSLARDRAGRRLLLGGTFAQGDKMPAQPARLWDLTTNEVRECGPTGQVETAFWDDRPVLLQPLSPWRLRLWDSNEGKEVGRFEIAALSRGPLTNSNYPVLALSPQGPLFAVAAPLGLSSLRWVLPSDPGLIVIWDADRKQIRHVFAGKARSLAFTPEGSLLAAGDAIGRIKIWSLTDGQEIATLSAGRMAIHCLAFHPNIFRRDLTGAESSDSDRWVLATGDAGGSVTLWDLDRRQPCNFFRGSHYDVLRVAFSPDGATLATGGRGHVRLWDLTRAERPLLELYADNFLTGLAFSQAGDRVIASSMDPWTFQKHVNVWQLHNGAGQRTLRGLSGQVLHVQFSPDDRLLAALADDWCVGLWDLSNNRLLHLFEPPAGRSADNAALAFGPNNQVLAFAAGSNTRLWDVASGKVLGAWPLPGGLQDALTFDGERCLLGRLEGRPANMPGPVVCVRHLNAPEGPRELLSLPGFLVGTIVKLAPGGRYVAIHGVRGDPGAPTRVLQVFDLRTGELKWQKPSKLHPNAGGLQVDRTGTKLLWQRTDQLPLLLLDIETGETLEELNFLIAGRSADGKYLIRRTEEEQLSLYPRPYKDVVVRLGPVGASTSHVTDIPFTRDGQQVAWGNRDGTVIVCDIPRMRQRLLELGFDWPEPTPFVPGGRP